MLQIRKLSTKTWKHIDTNDGAFILTKFYAKEEFNEFLIVESYGAKRRKYLINEIEVYDIGGTAETFANFEDLFLRLEALKYIGFYQDGDVDLVWGSITGTLSGQTDLQNALDLKLDKSSTPSSVYATDSGGLQVMKPISEFQTDISGKLDKVTTTSGVERAYIINPDGSQGTKATSEFKDVLEFADLAAFPVTGETGKIYLALDTNKTYRWSGSAYVQLSSGIDFPVDGKKYGVKNGLPIEIESKRFFRHWVRATGAGFSYYGANAVSVIGTGSNVTSLGFGGATFYQVATAATAGNIAEIREGSFIRKLKSQTGDFSMLMFFDANGSSKFRCFGGSSHVSAMGNINPSTYTSYLFGIGADDTDTNYQLIYGDSAGARTKIDLGWAKTGKKFFYLHLEQDVPNGNTKVYIANLSEGLLYSKTIGFTFSNSYRLWCGNSVDAIAVSAGVNFMELNINF